MIMAKIIEKFKNAGIDKWIHAVACFCIACIVMICAFGIWGEPKAVCGAIGWIAAVCAGIAKELYDFFRGNIFDKGDLVADLIGATIAFPLAFLM